MIQIADITTVAKELNIKVTEEEKKEVLNRYGAEQENDPTATWNLVVEEVLNQVISERE